MSKHDTDTSDQHAAKRRWLNAHEEGYHKAMGNRQVQMIAIGGAIGTGLFLGAGARLQMAGPALALVYLICGLFSFFILRALGELVLHRPSSGSFVSYAREFLGEKAAYVAGWMYFINWAMTGIVDITAVALYMHYWGAFGGVTNHAERDKHLRSADFLNTAKYPQATFTSTSVKKDGDELDITGDLTLNGVTKPVTLEAKLIGQAQVVHGCANKRKAGTGGQINYQRADTGYNTGDGRIDGPLVIRHETA